MDPGSPQLRIENYRPPTIGEWAVLQPFIIHAYKSKQHTARMILQDLSSRGFRVSDKVLRTRFKAWHIDDKNKRKAAISASRSSAQRRRAASVADSIGYSQTSADRTPRWQIRNGLVNEASHPDCSELTLLLDEVRSLAAEASQAMTVPRSFNSNDQLQRQQLLSAVANWYEHLNSLELETGAFKPNPKSEVLREMDYALSLAGRNVKAGWKILRNVGQGVSAAFQSCDYTTMLDVLPYMARWRNVDMEDERKVPYIRVIFSFLRRTSSQGLGELHPLTLVIKTAAREGIPLDLHDMLFAAMELNSAQRARDDSFTASKEYISRRDYFHRAKGFSLINYKRLAEVEDWFTDYIRDRKEGPAKDDDVYSRVLLAISRTARGLYVESDKAFNEALEILDETNWEWSTIACSTLLHFAQLKDQLGDLEASERLLQQYLRITRTAELPQFRISYALDYLRSIYQRQGRLHAADQLSASHPEVFGEEGDLNDPASRDGRIQDGPE